MLSLLAFHWTTGQTNAFDPSNRYPLTHAKKGRKAGALPYGQVNRPYGKKDKLRQARRIRHKVCSISIGFLEKSSDRAKASRFGSTPDRTEPAQGHAGKQGFPQPESGTDQ